MSLLAEFFLRFLTGAAGVFALPVALPAAVGVEGGVAAIGIPCTPYAEVREYGTGQGEAS